jgi:hypothetical protein
MAVHSTRAAVAIEATELGLAAQAIARIPALASNDPNVSLVRARYALACGEAGALDRLLDWRPPRLRGRAFIGETRRYHAYVLANALVTAPHDERRSRAAARLLADADREVRAYGAWLVALDDEAAMNVDSEALLLGGALARHEGLGEIAQVLETRATKRAVEGGTGPYRS